LAGKFLSATIGDILVTRKNTRKIPSLVSIIYFIILITLSVFAKDNLVAEFKNLLSTDALESSTTIKSVGTIEVAFSPNSGATASIIRAVAKARKLILVCAYSFTSKDLAQALLDAKKRNVVVKIILDKSQVSQRYSSSTFFAHQGFDLRIDAKHAIHHNKVMIIDDNTVITGSFNFTRAAETRNAENIIIINDNPQLARLYTKNWWFHWKASTPWEDLLHVARLN